MIDRPVWFKLRDFAANSEATMTDYDCQRFIELKAWSVIQLAVDPNYFSI